MTLSIDEKKAIIEYRIQKAWNSIQEAEDNSKLGYWTLAASRLYYAAYYMASALLVDKGIVARSHSGVIHIYDDLFDWTEEEVEPFFDKTKTFLSHMEGLITLK